MNIYVIYCYSPENNRAIGITMNRQAAIDYANKYSTWIDTLIVYKVPQSAIERDRRPFYTDAIAFIGDCIDDYEIVSEVQ